MTNTPQWVSQRAVAWVIDEAPVPPELAWTLVVIARACDEHGQGSWQSTATLAKKTGKSESQVKRDINRLLELGLLRLGDQTLPARYGVPAHRRPVVYDVALDVVGQKPARAPKRRGNQTTDTGITQKLDGMDATPRGRMDARGRIHAIPQKTTLAPSKSGSAWMRPHPNSRPETPPKVGTHGCTPTLEWGCMDAPSSSNGGAWMHPHDEWGRMDAPPSPGSSTPHGGAWMHPQTPQNPTTKADTPTQKTAAGGGAQRADKQPAPRAHTQTGGASMRDMGVHGCAPNNPMGAHGCAPNNNQEQPLPPHTPPTGGLGGVKNNNLDLLLTTHSQDQNKEVNNIPPLPPQEGGCGGEEKTPPNDLERRDLEKRVNDLVRAVRRNRPTWAAPQIHKAITDAIKQGHHITEIEQTMIYLAGDPSTRAPGRLRWYLLNTQQHPSNGPLNPRSSKIQNTHLDVDRYRQPL